MYAGNGSLKTSGALSIAVPGELLGLENAWKKYGRISWARLVQPSTEITQDGFKISPYLHNQMMESKSSIMGDEGFGSVFTSNGSLLKAGDLCWNKTLGETLKMISRDGTKAFYRGPIGVGLVNDIKKAGGILTQKDLTNYHVKLKQPISVKVMGLEVLGMPPPSAGGAALALVSQ